MKKYLGLIGLGITSALSAYQTPPNWSLTPWLPETLVIESALKGAYQSCDIATVQASLGTAYEPFAAEIGIDTFHSRKVSYAFEDAFLIGRYQWLNQNIGDPFSVVFGGKFSLVSGLAFREANLFHFGNREFEGFASIGYEQYCSEFATEWTSRAWLTAGVGVSNRNSPWFTANGAYEYAFSPLCRARIFADAIVGARWYLQKGVDVGLAGTYETLYCGAFDFSYAFRVYAEHVSRNVSTVTLCYYYP